MPSYHRFHGVPNELTHLGALLTSLARPGWTFSTGDSDHHAACGAARIAASTAVGSGEQGVGSGE